MEESASAPPGLLEQGRRAYASGDWAVACKDLGACSELGPDDIERLGWAALWAGRYDAVLGAFERAHAGFVAQEDWVGAARTALRLCEFNWDQSNDVIGSGWLSRAAELVDGQPESAEHGYLLWLQAQKAGAAGDTAEQARLARVAHELGRRVGSRDVEALALLDWGAAEVARGELTEGAALMDRAATLAMSGELTPRTTGVVYCGVIYACRCRGDWNRARAWTDTADRWVGRSQVAYFPGLCRTHRAEVLRIKGAFDEAERESLAATELLLAANPRLAGYAYAELGEVRRRRGDLDAAMEAFRKALELDWQPQPGLALVLLARGETRSAQHSLARTLDAPMPTWLRENLTGLLAARVTIALATGDLKTAGEAADALDEVAGRTASVTDMAAASQAAAEVALAAEDAVAAVDRSTVASRLWAELNAPFEVGRARILVGEALLSLGDQAGALLEVEAALAGLERIGARREHRRAVELRARCGDIGSGASPGAPVPSVVGTFRADGDYWTVRLGSRMVRLKDSLGVRYIAALLAAPEVEILAADLAAREATDGAPAPAAAARDPGLGAAAVSDAGERLDAKAASAYRQRLEELRDERAAAEQRGDAAAATAIRTEMEFLARELSAAFGLGGRARREGSIAERARQSVTKAIRKVIRRARQFDPEIGRQLEITIRTGTFCCYNPDPRVSWQL